MSLNTVPDHCWKHEDHRYEALRIIDVAIRLYRPRAVFALYSGGHDSVVSTHLASSRFTAVASIDTTIGIPQTIQHRRKVCELMGWPLIELTPPITYMQFCAKYGMPGPGAHPLVYSWLKERCIRQLVRDHQQIRAGKKRRVGRIMLISGVRSQESVVRMGHVRAIHRVGSQIWVAPCINWSKEQREVYRVENGLPANPVNAALGMSGECLCGAFAKPGELDRITEVSPETRRHIEECQRGAKANGLACRWGERPKKRQTFQPLCTQCDRKSLEAA